MKWRSGFTLVEVLVAIGILGIVGAALIAIVAGVSQVNQSAAAHQEDVIQIKAYIESVKEIWRDETAFESGTTASAPNLPSECTSSSTLAGDLRTLFVTCTDEGDFSLAVARP